MQLQLNAVDVFKAAVMLEERAARFYTTAAAKASGQPRQLLLQLSEMETGHARQFKLVLEELAANVRASDEPEEGVDDFLQALTGDRVITSAMRARCTSTAGSARVRRRSPSV